MALIKCPECGRENVSDTAAACPGCGFGIRDYFEKAKHNTDSKGSTQKRGIGITLDWYLCSECCESAEYEEGKHEFFPICPKCGARMEYMSTSDTASEDWEERTNNRQDPKKINVSVDEAKKKVAEIERKAHEKYISEVRCPRCGSTKITTGARGVNHFWGLIGASKTVNRCAKCGNTWTPRY